jgi:phosphopantothenoylcysteine synthetase/decarboxylase
MNTAMYAHKFTAKHLRVVEEELEYKVLGPQGAGRLACGDEGEFSNSYLLAFSIGIEWLADW